MKKIMVFWAIVFLFSMKAVCQNKDGSLANAIKNFISERPAIRRLVFDRVMIRTPSSERAKREPRVSSFEGAWSEDGFYIRNISKGMTELPVRKDSRSHGSLFTGENEEHAWMLAGSHLVYGDVEEINRNEGLPLHGLKSIGERVLNQCLNLGIKFAMERDLRWDGNTFFAKEDGAVEIKGELNPRGNRSGHIIATYDNGRNSWKEKYEYIYEPGSGLPDGMPDSIVQMKRSRDGAWKAVTRLRVRTCEVDKSLEEEWFLMSRIAGEDVVTSVITNGIRYRVTEGRLVPELSAKEAEERRIDSRSLPRAASYIVIFGGTVGVLFWLMFHHRRRGKKERTIGKGE